VFIPVSTGLRGKAMQAATSGPHSNESKTATAVMIKDGEDFLSKKARLANTGNDWTGSSKLFSAISGSKNES
jgi:hypothetical protein